MWGCEELSTVKRLTFSWYLCFEPAKTHRGESLRGIMEKMRWTIAVELDKAFHMADIILGRGNHDLGDARIGNKKMIETAKKDEG
jgi:hypothetical protein